MLRVNPIRAKRDEAGKQHRHDVIMDGKMRLKSLGKPRCEWPPEQEIVREEGYQWLSARALEYGFEVKEKEVRVDGYRQRYFYKPKGRRRISISTVDIEGTLEVADQERFLNALYRGIGPAKGFGCGLMLVRRA